MSKPKRELAYPRGVTSVHREARDRLQLAFSYQGVECRELLPPEPLTQTAINHAAGLRAEIRRKISLGTFVYAEYFPDSLRAQQLSSKGRTVTMRSLLESQETRYRAMHTNGNLAKSTLDGYLKAINSKRMSFWLDKTIGDATPAVLREWVRTLDVTPKRVRNLITPLRSVFEDALNDELITFNPFDRIALAKLMKETTKASDYEVDPFSADERAQLLAAARADERPLLQFWLNTGLRPGEMMALRLSKIDATKRLARIDLNLVAGVEKDPKTEAGIRNVALNDQAMEALLAQQALGHPAAEHAFVNGRSGVGWQTDQQIRRLLWQPLMARAKLRYRNVYQLRHTYASSMLTAGENPWYVAQQLGHVDVQMVFRVYGKFIAEDYRRPQLRAVDPPA